MLFKLFRVKNQCLSYLRLMQEFEHLYCHTTLEQYVDQPVHPPEFKGMCNTNI
jgi:hypothetical protein